jgi:mannose-6-phosphate isomerase-like protein (cupin superfamily)
MSGYTKTNLKQVEDAAPRFGLSPDLEARFARKALMGESLGLSYQKIAPNFRVPFGHKHRDQEEVYVLLSGAARLKLDDDVIELAPWDAVRIDKETMRGLQAGPDGAELLAFGAGMDPGDVEMLQGWWGD